MSNPIVCPQCQSPLTRVGELWICPRHVQVTPEFAFVAKRLFISYGHDEHAALARRLRDDLRQRGHGVWFDEERLRPGYDWEAFIERGLAELAVDKANSAVILLLTPHAVRRPDGYCLNEIARALAQGLRIIPLMVVESEPPLSICRIQWLDMRECLPISEHEATYGVRFERLLRAVEEGVLDFEGTQQRLIRALQPLEFDADIAGHVSRFAGREWVLRAIRQWLAEPRQQRIFWITGEPGLGKTALSAALSHRYPEVAALHMCKVGHAQKGDPRRVVTSLAYQLSTQLPAYEALLARVDLEHLVQDDPRTMFDNLLVQQLAKLSEPQRPIVILIDALDEATVDGRNELADFIAAEFPRTPPWLRLIITSRSEQTVTSPLQGLSAFALDPHAADNQGDITDYLQRELAALLAGRPDAWELVQRILEKSEGVFLYAERVCHDLRQGHLSLDRLDQFPRGLGEVFWQFLQRQFPDLDHFRQAVRPALRAILASREPLPVTTLQRLFSWQEEEVLDFTRSLGALFPVTTVGEQEVIKPYHRSFAEWLGDKARAGQYFVSVPEGHRLLAEHYWQVYEQDGTRAEAVVLRHILAHLRLAGEIERAFRLTADEGFVSRFLALETPQTLRYELAQAWAVAVERGTDALITGNHPATAFFAHGLYLAEQGEFSEAIGVLREGLPASAPTMAVLGWTEACWLAKDHLSPAEARFVITEGAQALSATLAETSDADHGVLGIEVARTLGWMLKDLGLAEDACAAFQMAVALGERLDNPRQLAWSARDLGCWYRDAHDFARARQWLTSAIGGFRALGDERQLAISLKDLGLLELEEASGSSPPCDDRLQAARSALQAALSLAEMLGDTDLAAWVNRYLGLAEAGGGELEEGRQRIERTAEQFWHFRDTNVALSQFCAQHVGQIRRPILVERFGHSHEADADFRGLLE